MYQELMDTPLQDQERDKMLDQGRDHPIDFQNHPIPGTTMMGAGKYEKKKTFEQIYKEDKKYVQWVRDNVKASEKKYGRDMKQLRIYVAMVDQTKLNRLLAEEVAQMPASPPRAMPKRGVIRTNIHMERGEMDWEQVNHLWGPAQKLQKWSDMAQELIEKENFKKEQRLQRMLQHPQGFNLMSGLQD